MLLAVENTEEIKTKGKVDMSRLLGLRNIVCAKDDWYYLVFYDIDREITEEEKLLVIDMMQEYKMSYILYKAKHGVHLVVLTPCNAVTWAEIFNNLKFEFKSYYSGNVIRLSRKEGENQELISINTTNGEVIPNLFNLYAERFGMKKLPWQKATSKYLLVFEKYRSVKE